MTKRRVCNEADLIHDVMASYVTSIKYCLLCGGDIFLGLQLNVHFVTTLGKSQNNNESFIQVPAVVRRSHHHHEPEQRGPRPVRHGHQEELRQVRDRQQGQAGGPGLGGPPSQVHLRPRLPLHSVQRGHNTEVRCYFVRCRFKR